MNSSKDERMHREQDPIRHCLLIPDSTSLVSLSLSTEVCTFHPYYMIVNILVWCTNNRGNRFTIVCTCYPRLFAHVYFVDVSVCWHLFVWWIYIYVKQNYNSARFSIRSLNWTNDLCGFNLSERKRIKE